MTLNSSVIAKTQQAKPGTRVITWGKVGRILPPAFGVIWLVIAFYPILFIALTSLRSQAGFYTESPWLPTSQPTLVNYINVLNNGFALYVINSAFVTVISIVLIVIVSLLAAYAISRVRSRFIAVVFSLFLLGLAIPLQATIIPLYVIINGMGLYDTLYALILPYVAFGIPLSVLVLVTYIRDIPQSLFESMLLDGASNLQILRRLVIPLSRPALITVVIYQSIQVWNGFLFPLVLTQSPEVRVLPLALWSFQGQFTADIPAIMAAVFLSAAPIILLYIFGRRQLLSGLTAGFSK
jgi:raffinose/stachyose/melibiose transport system permease protein